MDDFSAFAELGTSGLMVYLFIRLGDRGKEILSAVHRMEMNIAAMIQEMRDERRRHEGASNQID